jgi:hypothetical protein
MINDLARARVGAVGRVIVRGDEERTSPERETTRLAAASPTEARKGT